MDELKVNSGSTGGEKEMDKAAIARRRAMLQARRKKRQQMKMLVLGSMALIVVLAVILVVMAITALVKSAGGSHKEPTPTQTVVETPAPTPEPTPGVLQVKLENPIIENIESLDKETIGWGYGPSRDDLNRPVDAVSNQDKYGDKGAYFVNANTDEKVIYLTSDEGYEYGFTPKILDVLKETDTQIVFFVTKPFVEENPELVQRMIDEGHVVGNHSVNHPSKGVASLSLEEQQAELMDLHDYVKQNFDYDMWLFRYPAGIFSEQSLAIVNNLNYKSVFWSFAYADYDTENQPDEAKSLQKCLDSLHPGAIYLLHAVSETNTNILKDFIEGAKEQGYRFELIPAKEQW